MPLTEKGEKILHNMQEQNGAKVGESEFYASRNAGTISGVDSVPLGAGYDAERIGFKSIAVQNPVEKRMEERRRAVERGEDPYKRLNEEMREQSKDSVPLGKCYQDDVPPADAEKPHNYGKTIGFGPSARPEFPHPESPEGRARAAKGEGHQHTLPLGKDDVPPAVMSGDPVISPTSTSQYSGMQEQLRTAPQPTPQEPIDAINTGDMLHPDYGKVKHIAAVQEAARAHRATHARGGPEHKETERQLNEAVEKALSPRDSMPLSDLDAFARLGAGGDAWSKMTGRHDFSGDGNSSMGKLPEQVGFGEIKRMGSGFNYNQGYNGDPYKK